MQGYGGDKIFRNFIDETCITVPVYCGKVDCMYRKLRVADLHTRARRDALVFAGSIICTRTHALHVWASR